MSRTFNIYCDESCHLENDNKPVMLLGAIWCLKSEVSRLSKEIENIKLKHRATGELKWTKVSLARLSFYSDLLNWFVFEPAIHFRGLVVLNKEQLNHEVFNRGSHDDFYYKMYFSLLNKILHAANRYNIYLDIKDTRSRTKLKKLGEILCNDKFGATSQMIGNLQNIRSHESHLLQVCDFLLGAVSYRHRNLLSSSAKLAIVQQLEAQLGRNLLEPTYPSEMKFNLFLFSPRKA
ncbi:DUF3800 domain-containing protein [Pseudomonadota bacterium]